MQTISPTSITGSIRIKSLQRAMKQKRAEEHEAHLNELSMTETRLMPITEPITRQTRSTRPMLLMDAQGRPYVMVSGRITDTLELINDAVARYVSVQHVYPAEILFGPFRYLCSHGVTHYQKGDVIIPIRYDGVTYDEMHHDVMCRGALWQ